MLFNSVGIDGKAKPSAFTCNIPDTPPQSAGRSHVLLMPHITSHSLYPPVSQPTWMAQRRCLLSFSLSLHMSFYTVPFSRSACWEILFRRNFVYLGLFKSSLLSTDNSTLCLLIGLSSLSPFSKLMRMRVFSGRSWFTFTIHSFLTRGFYSQHRLCTALFLSCSLCFFFIVSLYCSDARVLGHIISQDHSNLYDWQDYIP